MTERNPPVVQEVVEVFRRRRRKLLTRLQSGIF